jgi:hypothetical protein
MKSIKSLIFIAFLMAMFVGCAGTKSTTSAVQFSPAGSWTTTIAGTPLGNLNGNMQLNSAGEAWNGDLEATGYGTFKLNNIKIAERKMTATFNFQGFDVEVEGDFVDDDNLKGNVYAMGDSFPFTAKRQ